MFVVSLALAQVTVRPVPIEDWTRKANLVVEAHADCVGRMAPTDLGSADMVMVGSDCTFRPDVLWKGELREVTFCQPPHGVMGFRNTRPACELGTRFEGGARYMLWLVAVDGHLQLAARGSVLEHRVHEGEEYVKPVGAKGWLRRMDGGDFEAVDLREAYQRVALVSNTSRSRRETRRAQRELERVVEEAEEDRATWTDVQDRVRAAVGEP